MQTQQMKKLFLSATLLLSLSVFSQKISNKLTFAKSGKLEMVAQTNSVISMEMMGQSMDTKVNVTITRLFDIEDVSSQATTIEHKLKRIQMNFEAPMAGSQSFDSDNEADMKGDAGKNMEKAMKNKYTITVDGSGNITNVKADDDNPNKEQEASGDMMANTLSQMVDGLGLPKAGNASEFKILPDHEVSKGESWTDTANNAKTVYTLADVSDTDLTVTYTGEGTTERKQEANGMEIKMSSKDKTSGTITLDRKTGLMKAKTETTDSEGTMEMMGQTVPTKSKITRTIRLKAI
jgi:hypothetical protein